MTNVAIQDLTLRLAFMTSGSPVFHIVCMLSGIDPLWFQMKIIKRLEEAQDAIVVTWRYNDKDLEATVKHKRKIKKQSLTCGKTSI